LVKFIILLHKVVDDYVTLFDVRCAINPDRLASSPRERQLAQDRRSCPPRTEAPLAI
jgi:hypothetical protein